MHSSSFLEPYTFPFHRATHAEPVPRFQGVDFKNLPLWKLFFSKGLTIGFLCRIYSDSSWLTVEGDSTSRHSWGQPASCTLHLRVHVPNAHTSHYHRLSQLLLLSVPQPSCYHDYLHKELKFLLTHAFFFFSKVGIKLGLKTVLMRWLEKLLFFIGILKILLWCFGTHLFYCLHLSLLYGFWLLLL